MTDQVNEALETLTQYSAEHGHPADFEAAISTLSALAHPARGVVDDALEWLDTEVSGASTRYHGDPSYDHDAYWMKEKVIGLIRECRTIFAAQAAALPAVPEVDPMAAFFAKRKEDEAQVFIARAKHALREILVALEDEDYEESRSLILDALGESTTPAHDQPEGSDND